MDEPLIKQAETLVPAANANAISAFIPLLDKYPTLQRVDTKHWDFALTIAGVFIAVTRLSNLKLGEHREEELLMKVSAGLDQWDAANGIRGFEHCKSVYETNFDALTNSGHERRFITSDAIGLWIVAQLFSGPQGVTEKEKELIRVVGAMVTHTFFNWRDDDLKEAKAPRLAARGSMNAQEAISVVVDRALDTADGRLNLANAEEFIIGELEQNRFNTERAIEVYKIAIDNSVWAWLKDQTTGRLTYAEYRRVGLGKTYAIRLTEKFKAKFNPPLTDQRPPRRFLRSILGA